MDLIFLRIYVQMSKSITMRPTNRLQLCPTQKSKLASMHIISHKTHGDANQPLSLCTAAELGGKAKQLLWVWIPRHAAHRPTFAGNRVQKSFRVDLQLLLSKYGEAKEQQFTRHALTRSCCLPLVRWCLRWLERSVWHPGTKRIRISQCWLCFAWPDMIGPGVCCYGDV